VRNAKPLNDIISLSIRSFVLSDNSSHFHLLESTNAASKQSKKLFIIASRWREAKSDEARNWQDEQEEEEKQNNVIN